MHPDAVFVSDVSDRDSIHRVSTGDVGQKMQGCLALEDAIGENFSLFFIRG
jgi:hypothetical protein